ncbi:A disintegrin and metalloproteinase with thrombospondin motifs like [Lineus longissimus]|uniref:A disintegrin and metalloproteinase with thrombospondin motifs like n=1 Tax=Lineus longissimus TaxID=88925 RepID=UPI00315C8DA3
MKSVIICVCALLAVVASRYIDSERVFIRDLDQSGEADPPIVTLKIDHPGKERSLTLRRRDNFNKNVPVFITGEDGKPRKEPRSRSLGTAYHDAENGAAFLISSDLTGSGVYRRSVRGMLHDGDYTIHLEPSQEITTDRKRNVDGGVPHLMVRKRNEKIDFGNDALPSHGNWTTMSKRAEPPIIVSKRDGCKTAYGAELMFFCDYKCYKNHNQNITEIREHFSYVINGMDLRYANIEDSSFSIYVRLVALQISAFPDNWTHPIASDGVVDVYSVLSIFTKWYNSAKSSLPDHDHAMLMTAYKMADGILGVAYKECICTSWATSVVTENLDLTRVIGVATHELGHNIGAGHDSSDNNCSTGDRYIMAPSLGRLSADDTYKNPYRFSSCSINYFKNAINSLESSKTNCLLDSAAHGSDVLELEAPGQKLDADDQCEVAFGAGYKYLRGLKGEKDFCKELFCLEVGSRSGEKNAGHALRGTSCGNKKWCVQGDCVHDPAAPAMDSDTCVYGDSVIRWNSVKLQCAQIPWACEHYSEVREHCCKTCA